MPAPAPAPVRSLPALESPSYLSGVLLRELLVVGRQLGDLLVLAVDRLGQLLRQLFVGLPEHVDVVLEVDDLQLRARRPSARVRGIPRQHRRSDLPRP